MGCYLSRFWVRKFETLLRKYSTNVLDCQEGTRALRGFVCAARGLAMREFPLKTGYADYLLFVNRKPIGVVRAKPAGTPLSGVELQSGKHSSGLLATLTL